MVEKGGQEQISALQEEDREGQRTRFRPSKQLHGHFLIALLSEGRPRWPTLPLRIPIPMSQQPAQAAAGAPAAVPAVAQAPAAPPFDPAAYQAALRATPAATFAATCAAHAAAPPGGGALAPSSLIDLILGDHAATMALFAQFFGAASVGADPVAALLACALAVNLKLHAAAETATLYPVLLNKLGPGGAALAQRALAEHAMVEASVNEILRLRGDPAALEMRVKQMATEVLAHVQEEERSMLPLLASAFSPAELAQLGTAYRAAKHAAPLVPGAPQACAGRAVPVTGPAEKRAPPAAAAAAAET
jgi:hypothetical protein